jgi:hypothetical protein
MATLIAAGCPSELSDKRDLVRRRKLPDRPCSRLAPPSLRQIFINILL